MTKELQKKPEFSYEANSHWNAGNAKTATALMKQAHDLAAGFAQKVPERITAGMQRNLEILSEQYFEYLVHSHQYPEAQKHLGQLRIASESPGSTLPTKLRYYTAAAQLYFKLNDYDNAYKYAEAGLAHSPEPGEPKLTMWKYKALSAQIFTSKTKLPPGVLAQIAEFSTAHKDNYNITLYYYHVRLTNLIYGIVENGGFNKTLAIERDLLMEKGQQLCEEYPENHGAWSLRAHIADLYPDPDLFAISEWHKKAKALDHLSQLKRDVVDEGNKAFKEQKELALKLIRRW